MGDEVYNRQQKQTINRIKAICEEVEELLGIDREWEIKYTFDPGYDGDTGVEEGGESTISIYTTTAVTTAQWHYKRAMIRWYLGTACNQSDEDLFRIAVHECVHILNSPIASQLKHKKQITILEEHATELMTRALLSAAGRL
jgi:hypothetical protein